MSEQVCEQDPWWAQAMSGMGYYLDCGVIYIDIGRHKDVRVTYSETTSPFAEPQWRSSLQFQMRHCGW